MRDGKQVHFPSQEVRKVHLFSEELHRAGNIPGIPAFIDYPVDEIHLNVPLEQVREEMSPGVFLGMNVIETRLVPDTTPITGDTLFRQAFPETYGPYILLPPRIPLQCDAQALRAEFEAVKTQEGFQGFLSRCGPFFHEKYAFTRSRYNSVSWNIFKQWQRYFTESKLAGKLREFNSPHPLSPDGGGEFTWSLSKGFRDSQWWLHKRSCAETFDRPDEGKVAAYLHCSSVLAAISASIELELLAGVRFRECAECASVFVLGHRMERRFCDDTCQHAFGQRRRRAKAKEEFARTGSAKKTASTRSARKLGLVVPGNRSAAA